MAILPTEPPPHWYRRIMYQTLRIVLLFLVVVSVTMSCQTTTRRGVSETTISSEELDEMEIEFSRFPPPPPQRSIEDIQEIVAEVDFSHKSACGGDGFYEVFLPPKGLKASAEQFNVPFAWRGAANTAFRHGDFDRALGYGLKYATAFGDTHLGRLGGRI